MSDAVLAPPLVLSARIAAGSRRRASRAAASALRGSELAGETIEQLARRLQAAEDGDPVGRAVMVEIALRQAEWEARRKIGRKTSLASRLRSLAEDWVW